MQWVSFELPERVADVLQIRSIPDVAHLAQVTDPRFIYLRGAGNTYRVRCSPEMAACVVESLEMFARDPKRASVAAECRDAAAEIRYNA